MADFTVEHWPLDRLQANPDNYRHHPEAQVAQLQKSLQQFGVFKNVVATPEGLVLAGHGVVAAAMQEGLDTLPVYVFTGSEDEQRKLMVADNELSRLAEDDDAQLSQLLAAIQADGGLEGTGYDEDGLAALIGSLGIEPLDWTPGNNGDQAGAGSAWGAVHGSDSVRLMWGDIEVPLDMELYRRVRECLQRAFDSGSSYKAELERIFAAGCEQCE
jgi:hypothetical protein